MSIAPWNAMWTSEARYELRPCRWAGGTLAIWMPHSPGEGQPLFAKPHIVRQRRSIAQMLCTVCGKPTLAKDRWWFALGEYRGDWYTTTEAPVHRHCAEFALTVCPHLRRKEAAQDLTPFPSGYSIMQTLVGGHKVEEDFALKLNGRRVVGSLKFAWPRDQVRVIRREASA